MVVLEAIDDAATVNVSEGWRMATFAEWKELRESCTWTWTQRNGINSSDKSIALIGRECGLSVRPVKN